MLRSFASVFICAWWPLALCFNHTMTRAFIFRSTTTRVCAFFCENCVVMCCVSDGAVPPPVPCLRSRRMWFVCVICQHRCGRSAWSTFGKGTRGGWGVPREGVSCLIGAESPLLPFLTYVHAECDSSASYAITSILFEVLGLR